MVEYLLLLQVNVVNNTMRGVAPHGWHGPAWTTVWSAIKMVPFCHVGSTPSKTGVMPANNCSRGSAMEGAKCNILANLEVDVGSMPNISKASAEVGAHGVDDEDNDDDEVVVVEEEDEEDVAPPALPSKINVGCAWSVNAMTTCI